MLGFGGCRAPNFLCLRILSLVLSPQKKLLTSPVLWAGDSSWVSCLLDTGQVVGGGGAAWSLLLNGQAPIDLALAQPL